MIELPQREALCLRPSLYGCTPACPLTLEMAPSPLRHRAALREPQEPQSAVRLGSIQTSSSHLLQLEIWYFISFNRLLNYLCLFVCVYVCHSVHEEVREQPAMEMVSSSTMWVLGIELGSASLVVGNLTYRAI